jgi:peptidoglycan/LPS O-acetylase OafA/YrhL
MSIRPKTSRKRVAGLDIIRFVAAALVMFYHLGTGKADFPELFGVSWSGFVGVEILVIRRRECCKSLFWEHLREVLRYGTI